jgi:hypothetical protein
MRRKGLVRLLKAWLFPLRYLESASGWLQVLWVIVLFLFPAGITSAISEGASLGSWKTVWSLVALLGVLLVLALLALWRATPIPSLTVAFDRASVQTPAAVDPQGNKVADARYFHFTVHSRAKVRGCRGRLILVERANVAGGYDVAPEYKPPINLTLDSVEGLEWPLIEPDLPARINLVFSESNSVGAFLCVPSHAASGNPTSLLPGKYRLTARVSAENVADVEERFIVRVTGAWSGLDVAAEQ